jgi:hypothetical protein
MAPSTTIGLETKRIDCQGYQTLSTQSICSSWNAGLFSNCTRNAFPLLDRYRAFSSQQQSVQQSSQIEGSALTTTNEVTTPKQTEVDTVSWTADICVQGVHDDEDEITYPPEFRR